MFLFFLAISSYRIPTDEIGKSNWLKVLDGHECTQSEWLCIKHFNPNDFNSSDGQIFLHNGAGPDPNRISNSIECKNCESLQNEVLNLRKQIVGMQKEHNLKLSQEKAKVRQMFKEKQGLVDKIRQSNVKLKQLNRLANEVASELMVNFSNSFCKEKEQRKILRPIDLN